MNKDPFCCYDLRSDAPAAANNPDLQKFHYLSLAESTEQIKVVRQQLQERLLRVFSECERLSYALLTPNGTTSNLLALLEARECVQRNVVICSNLAHKSITDWARLLQMECVILDVDPDCDYQVHPDKVAKALDRYGDEIAVIVGTFGTTQLGGIEQFVTEEIVQEYLSDGGARLHIDAAYGGLNMLPQWDKFWPYVNPDSVTVCLHKFTGVFGASALLVSEALKVDRGVNYFVGVDTVIGTTQAAFPAAFANHCLREIGGRAEIDVLNNSVLGKAKEFATNLEDADCKLMAPIQSGIVPIKLANLRQQEFLIKYCLDRGYALSPVTIAGTDSIGREYVEYGVRLVVANRKELLARLDDLQEVLMEAIAEWESAGLVKKVIV